MAIIIDVYYEEREKNELKRCINDENRHSEFFAKNSKQMAIYSSEKGLEMAEIWFSHVTGRDLPSSRRNFSPPTKNFRSKT